MKTLYDKLYSRLPDTIGRQVHVANSDPLYNKVTITDNGDYDVSSYAEAKINVENGGSSSSSGSFDYPIFTFNESTNGYTCSCSWTYEQIYEVLASDPESSMLGCIVEYPDSYSSGTQLNIAFDYDDKENIIIGDYITCHCGPLTIIYNSDNTIILEQDNGSA